ncbi:NAD-dependent epimerase/dehydratase family protein [Paenibacillus sacheonensis]|uniref:NAD-dependent epimerase/dehydratase family protein n=1 Tax=Paenibacillus sacheonensis TaxID=742054 RepID=A0A7X4YV45_9BACL|nr:NAD-dependent epimerase/dehydratase family protein [Paenibacillus sacheonensis]MBM7566468.1 nucleoside-diphosphate-sugar epimerase [Paenibacillus sacheonensis]NBC73151.1 NAD-dependent epimerase/dehydratase family protein [Paenibacillus sacheonensis]
MSQVLHDDLDGIVADPNVPWGDLRDSVILVTGATGAIGALLVQALSAADTRHRLGLHILALGRNEDKARTLFDKLNHVEFVQHDIRNPLNIDGPVDYIVHGAAVTRSADMVGNPIGVIETALSGTENILVLAKNKQSKSMVYLSSMEVYGLTDPSLDWVKEDDLGYINLKSPRSSYPESKRMCECLCNCSFAQYGIPVKVARLAQTFGAGFPNDDPRIFAQFARSSVAGTDIVLHTEGKSRGNYCYASDAIRGLMLLLLRGEDGETYNISNPETSMTIREMAELVAKDVSGGRVAFKVDKPSNAAKHGYAPDVTMRLSSDKIGRLGWRPRYGLAEMYKRMIEDWYEASNVLEEPGVTK